jgi:2-polyprenyl-6-methoxyphenol hydroxylase-like FAD-dependent oxidoreductase
VSWLEDDSVLLTTQPTRASDSEVATGMISRQRPSLLIAADGAARTVADCLEASEAKRGKNRGILSLFPFSRRFRVTRYKDDNRRVYKTIPIKFPKGWRGDLNYSARTKDGRINIDALPASRKNDYCAVLLLRADDVMAAADTDPAELRALMDTSLPMFSPLIDDATLRAVAAKKSSSLPAFRYVGPYLHRGTSTVLIGDAVHTVKPYFGLGANSALEDVIKLSQSLDRHVGGDGAKSEGVRGAGVAAAIEEYSKQRAPEARALVQISREFDRPGILGFVTFILPLILDGLFNGLIRLFIYFLFSLPTA